MITRRSFLGGSLAAAATAVPLGAWVLGTAGTASAATSLPVTIRNNSGKFRSSDLFFYVVGTNLKTNEMGFVRPDGTFKAAALSDNGADGFADLSIPFSGEQATTTLPQMSGRIYFSAGAKLKFKVVDGGGKPALQFPAGWVKTDPSFNVLHDCVEFTLNDAGMFCNTTMVDMFSMPLSITLNGTKQQTTGTLKAGGRNQIFSALKADPVFSKLVVNDLRVIAPGHGIEAGLFPDTFFAPFIDAVFAKYAAQPMTVTANGKTFKGQVSGGKLVFDGGCQAFAKPSTRDVLFCDGALSAPNDGVTGPVAAMLGAAFNRTTLLASTTQPVSNAGAFYQEKVTNLYSKAMHAASVDGKAYGFAFDDILDFAAFILDNKPTSLTVTLTPFA
ncbi:MAG: hypothetical protein QOJ50_3304 [Cryptosporangiaceae bacterium]|nr:hypothetical protein [Cryptosporangiaceae bacterium]